ncbi:MAG: hypothetical protein AAFN30_08020 [Actinomycetota bacterium]
METGRDLLPSTPTASEASIMTVTPLDPEQTLTAVRLLVAEEMHLLGLELEDALGGRQVLRLEQLTETLDEVRELVNRQRLPNV